MAKYGLFHAGHARPLQQFEGDKMVQNGEYVMIYKNAVSPQELERQVAAIRLDKGQTVKEI